MSEDKQDLPSVTERLGQIDKLMNANPEIDHSFYNIFVKSLCKLFSEPANSTLKAKVVRKISIRPDFVQKGTILYTLHTFVPHTMWRCLAYSREMALGNVLGTQSRTRHKQPL